MSDWSTEHNEGSQSLVNEPSGQKDMKQEVRPESVFDWWALALLWALCSVVLLQFVSRYLFNSSVGWTEEIARYLLVATAYFGSVSLFRRNNHIAIGALVEQFPFIVRRATETVMDLITVVFLFSVSWYAWGAGQRIPGTMASMPMPKSVIHYFVMVAFALMGIMAIKIMTDRLRGKLGEQAPISV